MPKVLVANRGEIAIRVLRSASELGWSTVALHTSDDTSHASFADEVAKLDCAEDFMNIDVIVGIATKFQCTHLHPGYGFLSENPALSIALSNAVPPIIFIGPSQQTLAISSDKISSRNLATSLGVNVAAGARVHSSSEVKKFAQTISYPIMIKALDGGGGRGIRVVETENDVDEAFRRCLGESPSRQVFTEKALTGEGWKHIEVQIIGDGTGGVNHFWERECSIQRRFQKIVEIAPSGLDRRSIQPLLDASFAMARHLKYKGLGTFEFLVNSETNKWVFLEINPRIQVEHTVTEEVMQIDLVRLQLRLFTSSANVAIDASPGLPNGYAVQLRLTAEDPLRGFQLTPGSIRNREVSWPGGRGIRIDSWISSGPNGFIQEWTVGTDFDSLLAKIIVKGSTFEEMTQKARRALRETVFRGEVKTNIAVLAGILQHSDWTTRKVDTLWLERNLNKILELGTTTLEARRHSKDLHEGDRSQKDTDATTGRANSLILQPGTLFHVELSPTGGSSSSVKPVKHAMTLSSIAQNAFPERLSGTIQTTFSSSPFAFSLSQSNATAFSSSEYELADPNDPSHVPFPITGKIVELHSTLVAAKDGAELSSRWVRKGETLAVLSVMKMENVILALTNGYVERLGKGSRVGNVMSEGSLLCIIDAKSGSNSKL